MNELYDLEKLMSYFDYNSIELSDIPGIDLYMDQVTTFMDKKLESFKRYDDDKILTKTMINNYTKNNVIPPPVKKKYTKEHMILLILVYHLKHILSLNDIQSLLAPIIKGINKDDTLSLEDLYGIFYAMEKTEYESFNATIQLELEKIKKFNQLSENQDVPLDMLLLVLNLIIEATSKKRLAEKIIDEFFKEKK